MTTIILGLGALSIVLGYRIKMVQEKYNTLFEKYRVLDYKFWDNNKSYHKDMGVLNEKHAAEKEKWRQTSSAWILEKEEMIERLEREKFDQLHELALMLNDSYDVDEIILEKAEKFDWLVNGASREQKRNFIKGYIIK